MPTVGYDFNVRKIDDTTMVAQFDAAMEKLRSACSSLSFSDSTDSSMRAIEFYLSLDPSFNH
jgi:hypothetical protein